MHQELSCLKLQYVQQTAAATKLQCVQRTVLSWKLWVLSRGDNKPCMTLHRVNRVTSRILEQPAWTGCGVCCVQVVHTRNSASMYRPTCIANLVNAALWVAYGVVGGAECKQIHNEPARLVALICCSQAQSPAVCAAQSPPQIQCRANLLRARHPSELSSASFLMMLTGLWWLGLLCFVFCTATGCWRSIHLGAQWHWRDHVSVPHRFDDHLPGSDRQRQHSRLGGALEHNVSCTMSMHAYVQLQMPLYELACTLAGTA